MHARYTSSFSVVQLCTALATQPPNCPPSSPSSPLQVGSATLTYAISDQLNLDYSLIFGASCLVGGLLGVTAVNAVVRRSSAGSLVVALMAVVVAAGAVLCAAYSVPQAVDQLAAGTNIGMGSFC